MFRLSRTFPLPLTNVPPSLFQNTSLNSLFSQKQLSVERFTEFAPLHFTFVSLVVVLSGTCVHLINRRPTKRDSGAGLIDRSAVGFSRPAVPKSGAGTAMPGGGDSATLPLQE